MATGSPPLSGRRAEAARNDGEILEAAREVFGADPEAPISTVAERAGVGIGALYRRYPSKDKLLQRLALEGLQRYVLEVERALAEKGDAWPAFTGFMSRALDAGTGSLTIRFRAAFTTTEEMHRLAARAYQLTERLLVRVRRAGALRSDIGVGDLALLFEQLQSIKLARPERTQQLRLRYLALLLDGLNRPGSRKLPGPAPRWEEVSGRYQPPPRPSPQGGGR